MPVLCARGVPQRRKLGKNFEKTVFEKIDFYPKKYTPYLTVIRLGWLFMSTTSATNEYGGKSGVGFLKEPLRKKT